MVDLQRYKVDVERTAEERKAIQQEHLERIEQGNEIWNAWATEVEKELERLYPLNASKEQKKVILNQYEINLLKVLFEHGVTFKGFKFPVRVNLSLAIFKSEADFVNTVFKSEVIFTVASFEYLALFNGASFESEVDFSATVFELEANFRGVTFKSESSFDYVTFKSLVCFWDANFESQLNFFQATFEQSADFQDTVFKSGVNFSQAKFRKEANFEFVKFFGTNRQIVDFSGTKFDDCVLLNDMEFSKNAVLPVDFRQAHFNNIPLMESLPSDVVILQKKS